MVAPTVVTGGTVDAVVVGAGVIGLAIGRALSHGGMSVVILEGEDDVGRGISSRQSEVVHSGIPYPADSLKARLCVAGRHQLTAYVKARDIPFLRTGKLIVATCESELETLEDLLWSGTRNGVAGLRLLDGTEVSQLEPDLEVCGALLSPETGIIDSHRYLRSLAADVRDSRGIIACRSPFRSAERRNSKWRVEVGGSIPSSILSTWLVNAAGLGAQRVARGILGLRTDAVPEAYLI